MAVQNRRDQVAAYRFLLRRRHAALLAGDSDSAEAPLRKLGTARSEERRVGKECTIQCRSRWSPYH